LFLSNQLRGSPLASALAAAVLRTSTFMVRRGAALGSAMAVIMRIVPPVEAAAEEKHIRLCHHNPAAVVVIRLATDHTTRASGQGRQERNPQRQSDPADRSFRCVHAIPLY
jgi:hypothetical protein